MVAHKKLRAEKWTALYVRLSRDDENEGDSNSIAHQEEKEEYFSAISKIWLREIKIAP